MAAYPDIDTLSIISPLSIGLETRTLISSYDSGVEVRKAKRTYIRRNFRVAYRYLQKVDARTLWQFFISRQGSYEAFNFFFAFTDTYVAEYVGTGDGATVIFNLPSKTAAAYTLYKNGIAQTDPGDYGFGAEAGADGADKVTMVAAPDDGDILTFDFTGYLKIRCRFMEDIQEFDVFFRLLSHMGIKLKGLLNT